MRRHFRCACRGAGDLLGQSPQRSADPVDPVVGAVRRFARRRARLVHRRTQRGTDVVEPFRRVLHKAVGFGLEILAALVDLRTDLGDAFADAPGHRG